MHESAVILQDLSDFVVRDPRLVRWKGDTSTRERERIDREWVVLQSIDRSMSNEQARANDVRLRLREIDRTTIDFWTTWM